MYCITIFEKIKSKVFIGFNIFLIIVGLVLSQLGTIVKFFNETFDYSETIVIVDINKATLFTI